MRSSSTIRPGGLEVAIRLVVGRSALWFCTGYVKGHGSSMWLSQRPALLLLAAHFRRERRRANRLNPGMAGEAGVCWEGRGIGSALVCGSQDGCLCLAPQRGESTWAQTSRGKLVPSVAFHHRQLHGVGLFAVIPSGNMWKHSAASRRKGVAGLDSSCELASF